MAKSSCEAELKKLLAERIVLLDGAMGTTIRGYGLDEAAARGERFADAKKDLLNNGDILSLTQPQAIGDIHKRFYEAEPHQSGKPYLCGHTIQGDRPTNLGFAICLDTCAYGGGWRTALDTETNTCYQTNERGKSIRIDI